MRLFQWIVIAVFLSAASSDPCQCKGKCPAKNPNGDVYFLAHQNCSIFCSCVHGKPFELPCPPGLHYSPKFRVCTYPRQAQCTPGKRNSLISSVDAKESASGIDKKCIGICPVNDIIKTAVILEHMDCGKFCKCDKGVPQEKECPAGLHFSPALGVCTYPRQAQCSRQTAPMETTETTEECCPCPETTTEMGTTVLTTTEGVTSPNITITELTTSKVTTLEPTTSEKTTTLKPTTSEEPTTLKTTTSKESTTLKPTTSEEPTTLNTTISEKPTTPEEPTTSKPTTSVEPTTSEKPTTPDPSKLCPADGSKNGEFYPHESSCDKYYICSDSTLYPHKCPDDLLYNPKINACDEAENVNCSSISISSTTKITPTAAGDGAGSIDPSKLCPVDGSRNGEFYPHESACDKYYICSDSKLHLHQCSDGLSYNPKIYACDDPEKVNCSITPTPTPPTTPPPARCPDDVSITLIPHETNCSLYYECKNGQKKLKKCPPGLHFNPFLHICEFPDQAGCT